MTRTERRDLAVNTVDSIFNDFDESFSRAVALFKTPKDAIEILLAPHAVGFAEYTGEVRNLSILLGEGKVLSWNETIKKIHSLTKSKMRSLISPGDYITIPVDVPAEIFKSYKFPAIKVENAKLIVTHCYYDGVVFNFEDVLFQAPMNKDHTNDGSFKKSLLAEYLNVHFLNSVFKDVKDCLGTNNDGLKVSLPTWVEVFGEDEDGDYKSVNWGEHEKQHSYFCKCTNRIKVRADDRDDTWWWWLSTPHAGNATAFCIVNSHGAASGLNASRAAGGVAPAICVS